LDEEEFVISYPQHNGLHTPITDPHKQAIGRYVAQEIIAPGDDIILEGGTTVASMIPFIDKPNITLLTNGLNTLALAQVSGTIETVLCCGGVLNQNTQCFIGPRAEKFFYSYLVDKVFVSAHGYISKEGFFDLNPLYDSMKKTICSRAQMTILLLDSKKFTRTGLAKVLDFNEVHIMVTDWDAPNEIVEEIRSAGVDIRIVPKP
jgi:DeoR/GlpR family transcriptional regulator of sugar metabolism